MSEPFEVWAVMSSNAWSVECVVFDSARARAIGAASGSEDVRRVGWIDPHPHVHDVPELRGRVSYLEDALRRAHIDLQQKEDELAQLRKRVRGLEKDLAVAADIS